MALLHSTSVKILRKYTGRGVNYACKKNFRTFFKLFWAGEQTWNLFIKTLYHFTTELQLLPKVLQHCHQGPILSSYIYLYLIYFYTKLRCLLDLAGKAC